MQPETWNGSWYLAALSLRYTPTTTYASPPGQRSPYSYGDQAYGYGGNYSEMDDQRMHAFPQASSPSPFVLGSTPTSPPQKKKEAHTTQPALRNPMKQRKYENDDENWREPERRKWGKAPPPVAGVVPPGAAEFQHSVRTTPHPFHPLHIPFDDRPPGIPFDGPPPFIRFSFIEFKRKGTSWAGINLEDAQSTQTKLAGNDYYTLQDLHADQHGSIRVRVRFLGYSPLTYEMPLDVDDGRVNMEALLRRVARACGDYYLQSNMDVPYRRIGLYHLEEVGYGVWEPMLRTL
ncbi:hypothetical protein C8R45DRAFT_1221892 [Mycena sanguinolenta]|nr:hypothetical protein C8R45DRAFT_1221892 [Mycena sanguinolenta]